MIYESLIAPHENPVSLRDIKRALLTYDKVKIVDADDRDLMPSNTFMSLVMGMPLFGMDVGPIRPMGKAIGYDVIFQRILEDCKPAIQQGLLEVVSTYDRAETKKFTIGGVPVGGYPLNTQFVFWLYRRMSQDQTFLKSAVLNQDYLLQRIDHSDGLSLEGRGDGGINDIPPLPLIDNASFSNEQAKYITQIARARIASVIKYAGYCEMKDLVPVFPSDIYGGVVATLLNNAQVVLAGVEEDPYWFKRNRVLELCHEEYLNDEALDEMSVKDAITLRTVAWGKQAEAREKLFESVGAISQELSDQKDFEKKAKALVATYRDAASGLEIERANLHFKIKCDIGMGVLGGGSAFSGLLTQLQSPLASMGVTLAAGGMWALEKSKDYVPALRKLKNKEESQKRGAGFGLQNFYSRIKKS